MVYFPERQADGTWTAKPVFTKRIPRTADFTIDGPEFELYQRVTRFVKRQCARAAAQGDDPRARAVGFLMSLYQRRLASSTYALRRSLENRARRLEEGLERAQEMVRTAPPDLPGLGGTRGTGGRRTRTAGEDAGGGHPGRQRRAGAGRDRRVDGACRRGERRRDLRQPGETPPSPRDHAGGGVLPPSRPAVAALHRVQGHSRPPPGAPEAWGFRTGCIHGGMRPGSRDEPGSRLYTEQQFREGEIQVLVATEARRVLKERPSASYLYPEMRRTSRTRPGARVTGLHRFASGRRPVPQPARKKNDSICGAGGSVMV